MVYHGIHVVTFKLKKMDPSDVLDLEYDAEGRVIVTDNFGEHYFLIANIDLINENK